jgi:segregation and condensation protein A
LEQAQLAEDEAEGFRVALPVFSGPMDLLLTLIRRERLEISELALAKVTDQFLTYLRGIEAIDPDAVASFCDVAATLMLIKSRSMLPRETADADVEDADAQALLERLRAYRRYKEVAGQLGEREQAGARAYVRIAPPPESQPELKPGEVSLSDLAKAFEQALADVEVEPEPDAGESAPTAPRVRLRDRFREIREALISRGRISFREVLVGERRDREYVIVSFLAVLEMLRRRFLRAVQTDLFGDIELEARPEIDGWDASGLGSGDSGLFDEGIDGEAGDGEGFGDADIETSDIEDGEFSDAN